MMKRKLPSKWVPMNVDRITYRILLTPGGFLLVLCRYTANSRILDIQSNSLMQWDKKRNSGKKFGYAANSNSWLAFWQDKWMERRENGKGYLVSASEIISLLPSSIAIPDESTINRHRKKLLAAISLLLLRLGLNNWICVRLFFHI